MSCCKQVAHGIVGLTKAALNIGAAADDVIEVRRHLCRLCEHSTKHGTKRAKDGLPKVGRCRKCKCWIGPKTKLESEQCPLGKW